MAATAANQIDPFKGSSGVPNFPARTAEAIDLGAADFFPAKVTKGIYVGSAGGNVGVIMADGSTGLFKLVPVGTVLPIQVQAIVKATTTSTDLVALY